MLSLPCGALAAQEAVAETGASPPRRAWNELDTSWVSLSLNFAAMEDGAFFSQDARSKEQVGDLSNAQLFRVDDLSLSGQLEFARPWIFQVGGNYRGLEPTSSRTWTSTDMFLSIPLGDLGFVTVGKQKEGVGLERTENARDIPFMELSTATTASTFVESHIVGVRFSGALAGQRLTWSAGWFNNWLDDAFSFSQSGQIFAGRISGLALDGGGRLLHLGVSGVFREAQNGSFRSKSIPEVYEAPDFVDTGSFPADHSTSIGAEVAFVQGPLTVTAEYVTTAVDSPQTGDPHFDGYYVVATWSLTGETRLYDRARGLFGAMAPAAPFSFRRGGPGAWEVAARYSSIDLTSGPVQGGKFERLSGALSWYATRQWRFEFNYGYGRLDRAGLEGHTHFYQLRLQFQL